MVVTSLDLNCQSSDGIVKLQGEEELFAFINGIKPILGGCIYMAASMQQESAFKAAIRLFEQLGKYFVTVSSALTTVDFQNFNRFGITLVTQSGQIASEVWA